MEHFPSARWVHFAQGSDSAEQREEVERHLHEGCADCGRALQFWRSITEVTRREARYGPPAEVIEAAKLAFSPPRPSAGIPLLQLIAHLVFDSTLQPSPAGFRGGAPAAEQLIYEAGDLVINVQTETDLGGYRTFLVGQVLSGEHAEIARAGMQVVLLSGDSEIAHTLAGAQGEFTFQLNNQKELRLRIEAQEREPVWVSLPNRKEQ